MRGVPQTPVTCIGCRLQNGCPSDQLCHSCRIRSRAPVNKRFVWTAALDERLRRAYQGAVTRAHLTQSLEAIQKSSGFTRVVILNRASELGLAFSLRRPWSSEEVSLLGEHAGRLTVGRLARKLNRTPASVKAKLKQLQLRSRVTEGYTIVDLQQLLGVSPRPVRHWIMNGWIRPAGARITESSVAKFLRQHPEQYRLSRVDEAWFKGLIFPAFNRSWERCSKSQDRDRPMASLELQIEVMGPLSLGKDIDLQIA